jgi:predicted PurR-regulated permease PerM
VRISLAVAGTAGALYLLYLIRSVLELILLAVFVALWLGTFVEFLTRRRVSRVVAILAAYLALFASILFLGFVAVPPIVMQIDAGVRQLPAGIGKLRENATFRKLDNKYKITPKLESEARKLPSRLASIAKQLSAVMVGAFTALTKLISVLALSSFSCATDRSSRTASTGSGAPIRRSGCAGSAPRFTDRCPATSPGTSRSA